MGIKYYESEGVIIRSMEREDMMALFEGFAKQGWNKPIRQFEEYYQQQESGKKKVIAAEIYGETAGYVTFVNEAYIGPFEGMGIPEIVDLNVLIKHRKLGIGNKLMDAAEKLAKELCSSVSLAVGLHYGYGSAQRMYIKRGYMPDGTGVWYKGARLEQYAACENDDDLVLYMKKDLI